MSSRQELQQATHAMESKISFNSIYSWIHLIDTLLAAYEISKILNTGLNRETLAILVSLIEEGVNPEALAAVVQELRREKELRNGVQGNIYRLHH